MTEPAAPRGRSVGGASLLLIAARVVGNAGFFVGVLVMARALGPSGRGTLAFVFVLSLVLAHVAPLGVTAATQVFAAQEPERRAQLLSNALLFTVGVGGAATTLVVVALGTFDGLRPDWLAVDVLVLLLPGTLAVCAMEAAYYYLSGCGRFGSQAAITAAAPWVWAGALGVVAAVDELTVVSAAIVWAVTHWGWAAALLVAAARDSGVGRPDGRLLRRTIRFGARAWVGNVAVFLNARADQLLLALIASEAALGIYSTAVNGAEVLLYIPTAVATALVPAIAQTESVARAGRALGVFRLVVIVTVVAVLFAAVVGPQLIPALFGEDFRGSIDPFLLLLPGALGFATFQIFSAALLASGSPAWSSLGASVALGVDMALAVILIPVYGAAGAAVAASIASLAGGLAAIAAYRRRTPFRLAELVPGTADVAALSGTLAAAVRRPRL